MTENKNEDSNENLNKAIEDTLQVDDTGIHNVKIIDMKELDKAGIKDQGLFLQGLLDAENNLDFNDSSDDYVKGYKYGKTGSI